MKTIKKKDLKRVEKKVKLILTPEHELKNYPLTIYLAQDRKIFIIRKVGEKPSKAQNLPNYLS